MPPDETNLEWQTASLGTKALWVLVIVTWLLGFGAFCTAHYFVTDERIQSTATTVMAGVWLTLMCLAIGEFLFDRYRR